jgi:Uma2 family endonuclease
LRRMVERHLDRSGLKGDFTGEDDLVLARKRVVRPDASYMTPEDQKLQQEANARRGKPELKYGRILVPPTLIIESVSPGHEAHDQETKRQWYAEAGVRNYWLVNGYAQTLECLVLEGKEYRVDQMGRGNEQVRPRLFEGLVIELGQLWA